MQSLDELFGLPLFSPKIDLPLLYLKKFTESVVAACRQGPLPCSEFIGIKSTRITDHSYLKESTGSAVAALMD